MNATSTRFGNTLLCCTLVLSGSIARGGDSAAAKAAAALPGLRVPVLGYVAAGSPPALRPILGVAGAAVLGDPLRLEPQPSLLAVSPGQSQVLIARDLPPGLTCAPLGPGGTGPELEIPGTLAGVDRAVFSPSGDSAVVSSSRDGRLQVLTGLQSQPKVAFEIDSSAFAASLRSLAVSDDGSFVLAGTSDGVTGAVRLFARDGEPLPLLQAGDPAVVRLIAGSTGALVVDPALRQVTILEGLTGQATARVFPAAADGEPAGPDDAVLSADGKRLYILYSSRREARVVDLDNGAVTPFEFAGGGAESGSLPQSGLSVRTSPGGSAVWLADFSVLEPRARYVPPLPAAAVGGPQEVAQ